ncbi:hypothetical protein EB796_015850 [Bugula neritina]|uniref:Uncharacterized protein n=1 Tax=Bugula neritina TaxID=10212 RepID=A0A7J7JHL7_BUGNE|nr:hypothetical protein EB796_015850 [Bugula neritina]
MKTLNFQVVVHLENQNLSKFPCQHLVEIEGVGRFSINMAQACGCANDDDIERAWALKSCLKDKALDVVKPILVTQEGLCSEWNRLDGSIVSKFETYNVCIVT